MSLKECLSEFNVYNPKTNDLVVIEGLKKTLKDLENRHGESREEQKFRLEKIAERIIPKFENFHTQMTSKEIRQVILVFQYNHKGRLLYEDHGNINKLLEAIDTIENPFSAQKNLLKFLPILNRNFHRHSEESRKYAKEIINRLGELNNHKNSFHKADSYIKNYSKFPIYDDGISRLSLDLIKNADDQFSLIQRLRALYIPLDQSPDNILLDILKDYLNKLPDRINLDIGIDPYYSIFKPDIQHDKNLKFPELKGKVIESLLNYFIKNDELREIRKTIIEYIDKFVGDPRIKKYEKNWKDVSENLRKVYLKYKIKVSVSFFFEFISKGSNKTISGQRHWEQRKEYWKWFLEKDLIDNTWVILGSVAENEAKKQIKDIEIQQYGTGNLRDASKSHIMMKIHNLIFVECSHDGALWIFDANESKFPPFGEPEYFKSQFDSESRIALTHISSRGYVHSPWKDKLDDIIQDKTRINIRKLRRGY